MKLNFVISSLKNIINYFLKKIYTPILKHIDNSTNVGAIEIMIRKEFLQNKIVLSKHQTLHKIMSKKIFIRLGDGELPVLHGTSSGFHSYSQDLREKMLEAYYFSLHCHDFIVGVNPLLVYPFTKIDDDSLIYSCKNYKFLDFAMYFPISYNYGDALTLRYSPLDFYLEKSRKNKDRLLLHQEKQTGFYRNTQIGKEAFSYYLQALIEPMKRLWRDKHVIICEGEFSCFGLYNDLLEYAKSVTRIYGANQNAFSKYNKILNTSLKELAAYDCNDVFVICALGHTSKILVVDLYKKGYKNIIDAGNLSISYDSYLYDFPRTWVDDPVQTKCYPPIYYGYKLEKGKKGEKRF